MERDDVGERRAGRFEFFADMRHVKRVENIFNRMSIVGIFSVTFYLVLSCKCNGTLYKYFILVEKYNVEEYLYIYTKEDI